MTAMPDLFSKLRWNLNYDKQTNFLNMSEIGGNNCLHRKISDNVNVLVIEQDMYVLEKK